MTRTDSTDRTTTGAASAERTWSARFAVVAEDGSAPAPALRRLTRGDTELGTAMFTTVTEPGGEARLVLVADDSSTLDRLTDRLHRLVAGAGLALELVVVERRGPDDD